MTPGQIFFIGLLPAFLLGYAAGSLHAKGKTVSLDNFAERLFGWFSQGNRLVALVVLSMVFAVGAGLYTFDADQSGKSRDGDNLDCLTAYVQAGALANRPVTLASRAAQSARRDWDRGFSTDKDALHMNKAELKARYLTLFQVYEDSQTKPLPSVRTFCEEFRP